MATETATATGTQTGEQTGEQTGTGTGTQTGEQQTGTQTGAQTGTSTGTDSGKTVEQQLADALSEVDRLRRSEGDARIGSKKNAAREALVKLAGELGVDVSTLGETVDPAKVAEKLTAQTAEQTATIADLTKSQAALLEAWKAGVPAEKAGYLQFLLSQSADYKKLDASASGFGKSLTGLITGMVAADSTFTAAGGVKQSGLEQHGGSGSTETTTEQFKRMGAAERSALYVDNRALYDQLLAASTAK